MNRSLPQRHAGGSRRSPLRRTVARRSTATLIAVIATFCWLMAIAPGWAQAPLPPGLKTQDKEAFTFRSPGIPPKLTLHLGHATCQVEIAATSEQRERGLMFRSQMPDNDGMIFLMPGPAPATFWMKNTLIPLSIAFLDSNGVILEIHDMKAMDETITRSDSDQVAYALEMNLHWFSLNGIKPGDKLDPPPSKWGVTASP